MRLLTLVVLGFAGLIGCATDAAPDASVEYSSVTGIAIGDDILVAMTRRETRKPDEIDVGRVRLGQPIVLSPALVASDVAEQFWTPQLAAIDGQAYLTFNANLGYHGAPLTADDTVDASSIVDLGYNPALTRIGNRFAAVSFPQQPLFPVFLPADTFRATFVEPAGQLDGELEVATVASPFGAIGLEPRCAGNARALALLYRRSSFLPAGETSFVARVSDTGALLDAGIQLGGGTDQATAGDAQVTVTGDGGVLVVYQRVVGTAFTIHAMRIEPGLGPVVSDQATDLTAEPALLVTSGDRTLAAFASVPPGGAFPNFASFETRILDDHGKTVSGPFTVATGDSTAQVIATSTGFAVLHGGGPQADVELTVLEADGSPGDTVTLATPHQPVPDVDPGGCASSRGPSGPGTLLLVLAIGCAIGRRRRLGPEVR